MIVARALEILERGATEHALGSELHGVGHWKRVALAADHLAVADADMLVVLLFAMIHDSQRHNDDHDPLHGPRAAAFALQFADLVDEAQLRVLSEACADHASGRVSTRPDDRGLLRRRPAQPVARRHRAQPSVHEHRSGPPARHDHLGARAPRRAAAELGATRRASAVSARYTTSVWRATSAQSNRSTCSRRLGHQPLAQLVVGQQLLTPSAPATAPRTPGTAARRAGPRGTTSRSPPVSATMHGQPDAIASSATSPNGS